MINKVNISRSLLFSLVLILFYVNSTNIFCQEVIKPPKYPNGIYTKESHATEIETINFSWDILNTPNFFNDTTHIKKTERKINYFKKYFSSQPFSLKECVYISPSNSLWFDTNNSTINLNKNKHKSISPSSFLFHSDTLNYEDKKYIRSEYLMYLKLNKPIEDFYQPFYFKKTEVTNKEYREFVFWVLDSIARQAFAEDGIKEFLLYPENLNNFTLNKKTAIKWNDPMAMEVLGFLYLPPEERFYKRRELDPRKMNYSYTRYNGTKDIINVYPDTSVWLNDFHTSVLEPLGNMYFWNAAFDNYPVVGITQKQAMAFLIWKTKQAEEALGAQYGNYIIKYELPSEIQWEMVATKNKNSIYAPEYVNFYDNDFTTSLVLKEDTCLTYKTIKENNLETGTKKYKLTFPVGIHKKSILFFQRELLPGLYLFNSNLKYNNKGSYPELIINAYKDENGIAFMGGNVSEWMEDTYKDNWLSIYTYHQNKLKKTNSKFSRQLLDIEGIYNSQNDTNGVLVRGGNWFDVSLSNIANKNFEGINKKVFVSPDKAFSTVGFRYVVKIYRKDEEAILSKQNSTTNSK